VSAALYNVEQTVNNWQATSLVNVTKPKAKGQQQKILNYSLPADLVSIIYANIQNPL